MDDEKQLDIPQEPTFLAFYRSLGQCPDDTFRLFDRTDFYTLHGKNAEEIAQSFFGTTSAIKYIGGDANKIASIAISQARYDALLRHILIKNRYRLELYKKSSKKKASVDWQLDTKASPGCLGPLEDIIYSTDASVDSRGVCAVQYTNGFNIGFAFVDSIANEISFCAFEDNNYLSNLESLLVQISPKECLIPVKESGKQSELSKRLSQVLENNRFLVTEVKKSTFNNSHLESDLKKLLVDTRQRLDKEAEINSMLEKKRLAKEALSATFDYLNLISDSSNLESFTFAEINLTQFVKLDATAVQSLDLFPNASFESMLSTKANRTLFQVLNKCRTLSGQRLLAQMIRQPLTDLNKIEERLDIIEFFIRNSDVRLDLSDVYLKKVPDLSRIYKKFHSKRGTLQDCHRIYQTLKILPQFESCLSRTDAEEYPAIERIFSNKLKVICGELSKLRKSLDGVIDEDRIETNGEFWIRADYDDDLKTLRKQLDELEERADTICKSVDKELSRELRETSAVKLEVTPQGFAFKMTRKNEKAIRNDNKYFEVKFSTKKDGFRFQNKQIKSLSDEYIEARSNYERYQTELSQEIVNDTGLSPLMTKHSIFDTFYPIAKYSESFKDLDNLLTYLDVMVCLSTVSQIPSNPYVRPKLLEKGSGKICLTGVRHPCLEMQENLTYIPNDCSFDSENHKFFFITGPNMGGKSTYIRSIALTVLMAQIGSYVPAESASISLVDSIFTRVGAGDKQVKGISTFMSEMIETAAIFRSATKDSLVVIDELGRGTSTYDGFGLAWAISEHLVKEINCYTLFATHFHELTDMSKECSSVGNLHLSAVTTDNKLTLLYKVNEGVCDQSFGINVAELANFPQHVIEYAKQKLKDFEGLNLKSCSIEDAIQEIAAEVAKAGDISADQIKQIIDTKLRQMIA